MAHDENLRHSCDDYQFSKQNINFITRLTNVLSENNMKSNYKNESLINTKLK